MSFCQYTYFDPRPGKQMEAIYVGMGQLGHRPDVHMVSPTNRILKHKLAKIKTAGLQPVVVITKCDDKDQAIFIEKYLISVFGRIDLKTGSLCNMTSGGDGVSGTKARSTKEQRKLSSELMKRRWQDPAFRAFMSSPEQVQRRANGLTGKPLSQAHRSKLSKAKTGKPFPAAHRANLSRAKRCQAQTTI